MILLSTFLLASFITMALMPLLIRAAGPLRFVDLPDARKTHQTPVPRIGGIAMVIGVVLPLLLWLPLDRSATALLIGIAIIVAFGIWDDREDLDYRLKFLGQLLAVAVVVFYGGVTIRYLPFMADGALPDYVAVPLTVIALLGITNAINLADGLDGLAGGTTLLSVGAIGVLAYMTGNVPVTLISVAVIGGILGFLRFNTYPARVFMGDCGSQFLGFAAGVLAIELTQIESGVLSPALPLILLGLPILDTLMVMTQRIREKRSPFSADRNHVHHKLLSIGFDHYEAVSIIYLVQSGLVACALLLRYQSDILLIALYAAFCLGVALLLTSASSRNWRVYRSLGRDSETPLTHWVRTLRQSARVHNVAIDVIVLSILCYYVAGVTLLPPVPTDISVMSAILMITLVTVAFLFWDRSFSWMERAIAYAIGAAMVYLTEKDPAHAMFSLVGDIYFVVLALVVAAFAFFGSARRFRMTTLDFLVIFIAAAAPILPGAANGEINYGMIVAKSIVLFYALEMVFAGDRMQWRAVRLVQIVALAAMMMRLAL